METVIETTWIDCVSSFASTWGPLIISLVSLVLSVISLAQSSKAQKLQNKVNELELKIKENELERIEKEKESAYYSCVEARIIKLGKDNYRMKVWNSGNVSVRDVTVRFDGDPGIIVLDQEKIPFDQLDPMKNFELVLVTHWGSSRKVKIITEWDDDRGVHQSKMQVVDY